MHVDAHPAHRPLEGITVVDFSRYLPGPFCTLQLAWLGASVVTVEQPPNGDPMRAMGPYSPQGVSLASASLHRGKQQHLMDLQSEHDRAAALALCAGADVVVESFRPGVADRLGIGAEALRAENPGLVYCSVSGYGQTGPWAQVAGHDANYLATAGLLEQCGPREHPNLPPVPLADMAGGALATSAICAALVRRAATGEGAYIDLSLTEAALAWQVHSLPAADTAEAQRGRGVLTGGFASYGVYECAEDSWLAVAPIEPKFFARLLELVGLPVQLATDQRDPTAQDDLRERLAAVFATRTAEQWHELLAEDATCATRVAAPREVAHHPQLAAREAIEQLTVDEVSVPAPASPFVFDGVRHRVGAGVPAPTSSGHA